MMRRACCGWAAAALASALVAPLGCKPRVSSDDEANGGATTTGGVASAGGGAGGAAGSATCGDCGVAGRAYPDFDQSWRTAAQVSARIGFPVRFVRLTSRSNFVIGEADLSLESVIVPIGSDSYDDWPTVYRLHITASGHRFVDGSGPVFLGCDVDDCALYSAPSGSPAPAVDALPGGQVPEGFIGTRIRNSTAEICVANVSDTMWCFDRTTWSTRPFEPELFENPTPPPPPGGGSATCSTASGTAMSLHAWQTITTTVTEPAPGEQPSIWAFTADGALVEGRLLNEEPACCCTRSEPLGEVLDVGWTECGFDTLPMLLTADAVYGASECPTLD